MWAGFFMLIIPIFCLYSNCFLTNPKVLMNQSRSINFYENHFTYQEAFDNGACWLKQFYSRFDRNCLFDQAVKSFAAATIYDHQLKNFMRKPAYRIKVKTMVSCFTYRTVITYLTAMQTLSCVCCNKFLFYYHIFVPFFYVLLRIRLDKQACFRKLSMQ